jgi:hypothetical protein
VAWAAWGGGGGVEGRESVFVLWGRTFFPLHGCDV